LVNSEVNPFIVDADGDAVRYGFGEDNQLRRLKFSYHTTKAMNGGTDFEKLYAYGARSFSIWDAETGERVFDSGSEMERVTANIYGEAFNASNDDQAGDDRSDNKGPEPEAIAVGKINGHTYAFVGMERIGGVFMYDVSNPFAPSFVQYVNNRDMTVDIEDAGDLGPESIKFVSASESPSGKPFILVGNEVSGTVAAYTLDVNVLK
jgi:hypothetical protein